jgi:hypothetical protein
MCNCEQNIKSLRLPRNWATNVRNAVLNVLGLVRIAALSAREVLIEDGELELASKQRLEAEVFMAREELRIKDARTGRIDPHRRPQYLPTERMAILELRAMRGWSKAETARRFTVTADTIRLWHHPCSPRGVNAADADGLRYRCAR